MTDQKTIDLLVRANIQGKKDLHSVAKSIDSISEALDKQSAAAKKGESSIDELKGSLAALEVEKQKLSDNQKLLSTFDALNNRLGKTEASATKAQQKYQKYREELSKLAEVTDKQQLKLTQLSVAADRAGARLEKQRAEQQNLVKTLHDVGLATDDLTGSQNRLRAVYDQYATVFAKAQTAISTYAQDVRQARDAEKALAAENAFQQKLQDAQKLAKADDYVQFWTKALNDAEKAEATLASNRALGKMADDAERSARSFTTLAKASSNLRPNVVSLRDAIAAIQNPGQAVRSTLDGVEGEVSKLAASIKGIKGPVAEYRATLGQLELAQKAIGKQAGLVDDFQRQTAALRAARTEFVNARAQVSQYADALRQGAINVDQYNAAIGKAQARARAAAEALNSQLQATRNSREALRGAGIASNDLAGAQARLATTARATVGATQSLTDAMNQYGEAVRKGGKEQDNSFFGSKGERTTLGFMQRLRGEVLSLAATFTGLYSVINTAKGALDAFSSREGTKNQLSISTGNDKAAIDAEYAYIRQQSDRIGLDFERTSKQFAKFSAAATLAGRSGKEIRYVFESFAEAGRVMNLSADEMDGAFKAIEQIYSKGSIQAEELRGQLGDRLFGAYEIAAKSLKDQYPDLEKAMKGGLVTSDQLIKIAQGYRDIVADQLPAATKSLVAEQMRMNNALTDFKLAVADGGWVTAYQRALVVIVDFLKSADGKAAAQQFADALKVLADMAILVVKNIDLIVTVLKGLVAVLVGTRLLTIVARIAEAFLRVAPAAGAAAGGIMTVGSAINFLAPTLVKAIALLGSFAAGFAFGTLLYEQSAEVRKFGAALVTGFAEIFARVKFYFSATFAAFPLIVSNVFNKVLDVITNAVKGLLGVFAKLASAVGLNDLAAALNAAATTVKVEYADVGAAVSAERKKLEAELANIRDIRDDMMREADRKPDAPAAATVAPVAQATPFPGVTPSGKKKGDDKDAEKKAKELERLRDQIERGLQAMETKIDRQQTDSLKSQLEAVDGQYKELKDKIAKVGGETGRAYMEQLERAMEGLKANITNKFNKGLEDDFKALEAELANVSAATGRKDKLSLEARQKAIEDSYTGLYQKIADIREKLLANDKSTEGADNAKATLDRYIVELKNLEAVKVAKEELERREQRMNELLKLRDAQIAVINAKKEAGAITDAEAAAQINQITQDSLAPINAAGEATRQWAIANAAIFASPADKEIFIAQMDAILARVNAMPPKVDAVGNAITNGFVKAVDVGLESMHDNLAKVVAGQQSVEQGFHSIGQAFMQFAAQFLREIAMMIAKQAIFNAMKNSGNPFLMGIGAAGSASVKHAGGLVGHYGGSQRTRNVDSSWFANAPRYHSGGVPGLKPDEYATILQKGEEVLAADSPRNILNGGGMAKTSDTSSGVRMVLVDDRAKVTEAMATPDGEQVIVQALRRNLPTVRQMLKA